MLYPRLVSVVVATSSAILWSKQIVFVFGNMKDLFYSYAFLVIVSSFILFLLFLAMGRFHGVMSFEMNIDYNCWRTWQTREKTRKMQMIMTKEKKKQKRTASWKSDYNVECRQNNGNGLLNWMAIRSRLFISFRYFFSPYNFVDDNFSYFFSIFRIVD